MNTAQKIVKYFAIGFAALLIVSICSGIVFGGLGILTAGKLISDNSKVETVCTSGEEPCLQINLSLSELNIKKGESLDVDTKNDQVEVTKNGQSLVVVERGRKVFDHWDNRTVTVYVPEETEFEKTAISGGAGSMHIETLHTKSLEMSLGIGEAKIENLDTKDAKISTGIGALYLGLVGTPIDYEIKVSKGIGKITFNGKSVSDHSTLGDGHKKIDVSGGIGSIDVITKE